MYQLSGKADGLLFEMPECYRVTITKTPLPAKYVYQKEWLIISSFYFMLVGHHALFCHHARLTHKTCHQSLNIMYTSPQYNIRFSLKTWTPDERFSLPLPPVEKGFIRTKFCSHSPRNCWNFCDIRSWALPTALRTFPSTEDRTKIETHVWQRNIIC